MNIITLDFESLYSDDYTLSRMTTESYVRDPRFEAHGVAIKWASDQPARWYDRQQTPSIFKQFDWAENAILCHHANFDGLILSHHYGIKPKFWLDTLSMARLLLGNHLSVSLDNLAKHFGLAAKTVPYNLFKGKHWHELSPAVQQMVGAGACRDVELTWQLFNILAKNFPMEEYEVVDSTVRMFTEPVLRGDVDILAKLWEDENNAKSQRMLALGIDESALQSSDRFAELLRLEGVEPETKTSPKGNEIYAFAKNDQFMRDLLEDDNERVRALAEARLGAKSTLLQTRAETLGWMARRGPMPVYLRYAGASTLRFSGGDGANWQNFKRKDKENPKATSPIRRSIMAPEGYWLAPIDSSQIEARVCAYLAGQNDLVEKFRNKEDPYIDIASKFYGRKITKDNPSERGTGKQLILSCQYGSGAETFLATAKLGIYGPPVIIDLEEAGRAVNLYRYENQAIVEYWKTANRIIARLAGGPELAWGPMTVKDHKIFLANGCMMHYDTIEYHVPTPEEAEKCKEFERDGYWRVKTRHGWKTMWGSTLVQNVCEAVSRVIVTQAMIRIKRLGFRTLNIPHDELLLLIPRDRNAEKTLELCLAEMKRTPDWLPGLPLDADGELSDRYEKA